jgi:hypothetical protein
VSATPGTRPIRAQTGRPTDHGTGHGMTTLMKYRGQRPDQGSSQPPEIVTEVGKFATSGHTVDKGEGGGQGDDQADQSESSALYDDGNGPVRDDPTGIG